VNEPRHPLDLLRDYDARVTAKALELSAGMPDAFNMTPLLRLVREAWGMGLDITRKERTP
jgi:hypothetical protein